MAPWSTRNTPPRTPPPRHVHLRLRALEGRNLPTAGGGFTAGGVLGEYFDNSDLAGQPAFVRRDVRIDFAWQDRAPGGSTSPEYRQVGADHFSVRWTGQVVPRYSETYTFHLTGDDGARLWVRPAGGASSWNLLIDAWETPAPGPTDASYSMTSGRQYDVKVEYREETGPATARLTWSGRSTPEEVIEPAANLGVNAVTYDFQVYADAIKTGRNEWGDPVDYFGRPLVATDALGWPLADAGHLFWESRDPAKTGGTYLLRFTGQAEVTGWLSRGRFRVAGVGYGNTLPLGVGYDPLTNTTTAEVVVEGTDLFGMNFVHTKRTPDSPEGTGVTDVKLMRPVAVNSDTHYQPGELFDADVKQAFSRFTTIRHLTANFNPEKEWADRKLPGLMQAAWGDRAAVWEYEVMLANETGKDLYITLPVLASEEYVHNLALLIRYGSDGVNPYTGPVADPVYPGLNPNLRVYVEWGNEFWNWAFSQGGWAVAAGETAVRTNTPEGRIVNFDGQRPVGDFRRWAALRTVVASNAFREVWGDAAMGDRVRVLFEYQYNNQQSTAVESLQFIDKYFNNGDGQQHVAEPHPVSYYIWGAGGAAYFGAANPRGLVNDITVPGGTFEAIRGNPGGMATPNPAGSPWHFEGDAGIYRNLAGSPPSFPIDVIGLGKVPATPGGMQAMYITGTGSASLTITFPRAGLYSIDFQAAAKIGPDMGNQLDFYFNDQRVTPNGRDLVSPTYPWWPGNGHRDAGRFSTYGTVPVEVPTAGRYTFRIVGRGAADHTTVIDDVRVASLNAIFASRIPTGVRAAGEVTRLDLQTYLAQQAAFTQAYGLQVVAYEGGWSLGGDFGWVPLMSWAKYRDPRAGPAMAKSIDAFFRSGGEVYVVGSFDQWYQDDAAHADSYPIVQGIDARLAALPPAPTARLMVGGSAPVTLPAALGLRAISQPVNAAPGEWVSWTVRVTTPGNYRVTARAAPDGFAAVIVDGVEIGRGSSGLAPGGLVHLEAGVHTIRVQSIGGWFVIRGVTLDWIDNLPGP
ncbi:MAG TPA: PA14 domain-containing protein [Gemmataceae bacterium]|nr:PA14 domain-containing protein [Gemmataceae bacterium]